MKYIISFYLLLTTYYLHADMPGNKPRPDYKVKVSGLVQYADYAFYYQGTYDKEDKVLKDGDTVLVQGGFGAPQTVIVWAVQQKKNQYTDTIYFSSGDEEVDKAGFVNITDNHLTFTEDTTFIRPEKNNIPFGTSIGNIQDDQSVKNRNIMYFISGLSFIILLALVFFIWSKNRKSKIQKPV